MHKSKVLKHSVLDNPKWRILHLYLVHSLPGIACLINTLITNAILKVNYYKPIILGSVFLFI